MQQKMYRIRNWAEYNRSLIQNRSLTVWIEDAAIKNWLSNSSTDQAGRPEVYSDDAILMLLVLRERYGLTLRGLQGFATSLFQCMGLMLPIPSYTQICRRARLLHQKVQRLSTRRAEHIVFDSTGLKVFGEGEWKVRVHGKSKRRTWRKLHIGIDASTQDIIVHELTTNDVGDAEVATRLMDKVPSSVKSVRGDGAYDAGHFREKVKQAKARAIIPPPRNAAYKGAKDGWGRVRDETIAEITGLGSGEDARRLWKILVGYHKRSLAETAMFRIKRMLGDRLKSRTMGSQCTEVLCKCLIINKMNKLGLPRGEWVDRTAA